jgi:cathepsin L
VHHTREKSGTEKLIQPPTMVGINFPELITIQGTQCNADWAFAAVQQIESDAMCAPGSTFNSVLSAEQLLDCSLWNNGCNGGYPEDAFKYAEGGVVTDSQYPYKTTTSSSGYCQSFKSSAYVVKVKKYYTITNGDDHKDHGHHEDDDDKDDSSVEEKMAAHILNNGPLSACFVDPKVPNGYTGVVTNCGNTDNGPTVCGQVVGVDTSASPPFWKVRGSWGTSWGDGGYIRIQYGVDMCMITHNPQYVELK